MASFALAAPMRLAARQAARQCLATRAAPAIGGAWFAKGCPAAPAIRCISAAAAEKVSKVLSAELKHEEEQYEQPKEIKDFLKATNFTFVESNGDVNMALERTVGEKTVRIEWQIATPYNPEIEGEEKEGEVDTDQATELSVSVESKSGTGMTFYCSTLTGEDHRYVIGNVKSFASTAEKESDSSYLGADFEDLDDKLQEALDEYLTELGMSNEICDFIDAVAFDKEQREYTQWLKRAHGFLSS
mmetsp:Transcript_3089/g.8479  ORF Transcript_3089/g.8479 Transcript_3089/m.8479 type:complete len:244 (-) Transcript_3089:88-819(-)